jgi:hypothetical protein
MRYVGPVLAAAAVRVSVDGVMPPKGVLQRDLIPFLTNRYEFNVSPQTGPGVAASPILTFASGVFDPSGDRIPIVQILIFPDGLAVFTKETDGASSVLEDLMFGLDEHLGYRHRANQKERLYLSQLTVEFDDAFVQQAETFLLVRGLVNNALHREAGNYKLKRLAFGRDTDPSVPAGVPIMAMDQIMLQDFLIERRAGESIQNNVFFCSAPLATNDHLAVLEKIENACRPQG